MRPTILWILILMLLFLCGCRSSGQAVPASPPDITPLPKEEAATPPQEPVPASTAPAEGSSPQGQLMCSAEDQREAEEIAELYGITLVDFGYGVALYHTEEDPEAVIARGEEKGWPRLSRNHTKQLH